MFNKLVISAAERRKGRTTRFFCGTAVFYMLSVAASFAISIILSNPNLADTSEHSVLMITPPLPEPGGPPRPVAASRPQSQTPPRNDATNPSDLETVIRHQGDATRPTADAPPGITDVVSDSDAGGGGGGNVIGLPVPGGPGTGRHEEIAPPPRPPDPPAPAQVKPADNKPLRMPSNVLQGKATARVTPDYPALAKQIHLEGSVSVEVMISPDGRVESARAISGHDIFKLAAVKAAERWRFDPTFLNGIAVRVTGVIVFNFRMQ